MTEGRPHQGYIDNKGELAIDKTYYGCGPFSDGYARVTVIDESEMSVFAHEGIIDAQGDMVLSDTERYSIESNLSEGLALVRDSEDLYGYVDLGGEIAIDTVYTRARPFSEGLASARIWGLYGYIDKNGEWAIEPDYHQAYDFIDGLAYVETWNHEYGLINKQGEMVLALPKGFGLLNREVHEGLMLIVDAHIIEAAFNRP